MKHHYIYFILIPVLLVLALALPFFIYEYDGERDIRSGFHDGIGAAIFLLPTLLGSLLLLIKNRITAILGSLLYFGAFCLACIMNYVMSFRPTSNELGPGPFAVLLVTLLATIVAITQSVRLVKNHKPKHRYDNDLLDVDNL